MDVDAQWIQQQIERRRNSGADPCVRIVIHTSGANLALETAACSSSSAARRKPTPMEQEILDHWTKGHLSDVGFSVTNLLEFVYWVKRHIK